MLPRQTQLRLSLGLLIGVALMVLGWLQTPPEESLPIVQVKPLAPVEPVAIPTAPTRSPPAVQQEFELKTGQALVHALRDQGIEAGQSAEVAQALTAIFDVRKLRAGQRFTLTLKPDSESPEIESLSFKVGLDRQIVIQPEGTAYVAEEREVPHERRIEAGTLVVRGSLGEAAEAAGVPQEVILEIVQQLGYRIDFNRDLREGDRIDLTYERFIHVDEGTEHVGGLLSARLQLENRAPIEIYRYTTRDGIVSFFDKDGESIETELARTPVVGGYLTSSYGPRLHPILRISRMHKGMDFAAPKGSAVVAVRAGRIARANRNGSFGKYIRIDHGNSIETAYAHLSAFREGLKKGDRVAKGETIGYVGESGLATSPSLHYEVLRNGRQVDPRAFKLPPRIRLQGEELARFRQRQETVQAELLSLIDEKSDA